jgi:hypothetical protein
MSKYLLKIGGKKLPEKKNWLTYFIRMGISGLWKLDLLYSQVENKGRPRLYVKNVCKYAYILQKACIYH